MRKIRVFAAATACTAFLAGQGQASAAANAPAPPRAQAGAAAKSTASDPAAQSLFERALRRLSGYRDFQARFVESSESRAGTGAARESGHVYFKRPGLWRWEYTDPEPKVVTIRGREAEIAMEGDPQVSRYDLGSGDGPSGVGALLAGGEGLSRAFVARFEKGVEPQTPVLRLDPLSLSDDYEYILMRVRRSDQAILEVVIVDPGGNRLRFKFDDLRPDRGLPDTLFRFTSPAADARAPAASSTSPGER